MDQNALEWMLSFCSSVPNKPKEPFFHFLFSKSFFLVPLFQIIPFFLSFTSQQNKNSNNNCENSTKKPNLENLQTSSMVKPS
jgi:hypothetical protein